MINKSLITLCRARLINSSLCNHVSSCSSPLTRGRATDANRLNLASRTLMDNHFSGGKNIAPTCSFSTSSSNEEPLLVDIKNQVLWLKFNRPKKFNAFTFEMYSTMIEQLTKANEDPNIKVVVLTGVGKYYSSGNDLTNFLQMKSHPGGFEAGAKEAINLFKRYVESLIKLEKFAIGAVNGPAVGFTCTSLPLLDYVLCSDTATFYTPFTSLGQSPEACSTVTFPRIMGTSRASELLLMNKTIKAEEAKLCGLVSNVISNENFESTLNEILFGEEGLVKNCFPESLKKCKGLIRDDKQRQMLLETNEAECDTLMSTWLGDEVQAALVKFFDNRSNKK